MTQEQKNWLEIGEGVSRVGKAEAQSRRTNDREKNNTMTTETTTETKVQGYAVIDIAELKALLAVAERKSHENYGCVKWFSTVTVRFDLLTDYNTPEGEHQVDGRSITVNRKSLDEQAKFVRQRME